jgi:hypothetical protein
MRTEHSGLADADTAGMDGLGPEQAEMYMVHQGESDNSENSGSVPSLDGIDVWSDLNAGKAPTPLQVLSQNGQEKGMQPPPTNQIVKKVVQPIVQLAPSQIKPPMTSFNQNQQPAYRQTYKMPIQKTPSSAQSPAVTGAPGSSRANAGGAAGFTLPEGLLIDPIVAMEALRRTSGS